MTAVCAFAPPPCSSSSSIGVGPSTAEEFSARPAKRFFQNDRGEKKVKKNNTTRHTRPVRINVLFRVTYVAVHEQKHSTLSFMVREIVGCGSTANLRGWVIFRDILYGVSKVLTCPTCRTEEEIQKCVNKRYRCAARYIGNMIFSCLFFWICTSALEIEVGTVAYVPPFSRGSTVKRSYFDRGQPTWIIQVPRLRSKS